MGKTGSSGCPAPGNTGVGDVREMVMEPGSSKAPRFYFSRDPER